LEGTHPEVDKVEIGAVYADLAIEMENTIRVFILVKVGI
jgi:hypothetical protein